MWMLGAAAVLDGARPQQVRGASREWGSLGLAAGGGRHWGRCGEPAAQAAGVHQGCPAGNQSWAGESAPCPKGPLPTPQTRPEVCLTSGPEGHPRVGRSKLLTWAANENGRRAVGRGGVQWGRGKREGKMPRTPSGLAGSDRRRVVAMATAGRAVGQREYGGDGLVGESADGRKDGTTAGR